MNKIDNNTLAEIMFPDVKETIADLEKRYPPRNMEGKEVTRFAPSPTGFLHLGSLFTAMVTKKVAFDSRGVCYLRIEDTDTKREVEGSSKLLVNQLARFHIAFDEGNFGDYEIGDYGPYKQSERADIYRICIKELVKMGRAYPCFCSKEELEEIRLEQEKAKVLPGYYGEYAKCAHMSNEEYVQAIKDGRPYVVRFRSLGNHHEKITFHDLVRGDITIAQNDLDVVILKSDGLPTYHFAHAVDDHFMRTTTVIRGEEWISSVPIHLDLFDALGFPRVKYAHLPVLMKMDGGSRRKLSKRKDKEASVDNFIDLGYPPEAIIVYLMSVADSSFEDWTTSNNSFDVDAFHFRLEKMSLDGMLFDNDKLDYFSKEIIARMSASEVYEHFLEYSKEYEKPYASLIEREKDKTIAILNIEREGLKPRKDYAYYSMIFPLIKTFYNEMYDASLKEDNPYPFDEKVSKENIIKALKVFVDKYDFSKDRDSWFDSVKLIGEELGYASRTKDYKNNPDAYIGSIADFASIIRVATFLSKNSPNLYDIFNILGEKEIKRRINLAIERLA